MAGALASAVTLAPAAALAAVLAVVAAVALVAGVTLGPRVATGLGLDDGRPCLEDQRLPPPLLWAHQALQSPRHPLVF